MEDLLKLWIASSKIKKELKEYIYDNFQDAKELKKVINSRRNKNDLLGINISNLKQTYRDIEEKDLQNYMEKNNIRLVMQSDEKYPKSLKDYNSSPFALFYKGDISKINERHNLSVVGSRKCTRYGEDVTRGIISQLKNYNMNIISGMAKGIDSISHKSAIDNGINTVAVLGSGIDVVYPKQNVWLYNEILSSGGCILSEYPIGEEPVAQNFPIRNRIISGIGEILLVTEGGRKSGTLITVGTALQQGKTIVTVPGSIFSKESVATNQLAHDGAVVFTEMKDLTELFKEENLYLENKDKSLGNTMVQRKLLEIIDDNPIHIDDIINRTNVDIKQLYKLLFELQAKEEILCLSGNFYVKVNKILKCD